MVYMDGEMNCSFLISIIGNMFFRFVRVYMDHGLRSIS